MKTIAFFNNKGGVGKTSLVYHLAWMLGELGHRVITVDLDPQANLSGIFLNEERLDTLWSDTGKTIDGRNTNQQNKDEKLWSDTGKTIDGSIAPLFDGTGDISNNPSIEKIEERIGLLVGDLALSNREDELSLQWPICLDGKSERAFRVMSAFARLIDKAGKTFQADLALVDVGPNLGAINRAALIASDYVIIPLAPDLFSLQGLRNVGPTLKDWRKAWKDRVARKPEHLEIHLPKGEMKPLGYIVMRHSIILNRPVKSYLRWINKIPTEYREFIMGEDDSNGLLTTDTDENLLAHLKDYRSLMPMAQDANKPMFMLKPADGVIGAQQNAVESCYTDFQSLAKKILRLVASH